MPRKTPDTSFFTDEPPDSFENEEFTTEEVLDMGKGEDEEKARVVDRARRAGRNVERTQRPVRGHISSARQARVAQQAKRENPVVWKPVESLDAPPAPPGCVLRWIRFKLGDREDPKNLSKKFRTGWKPYLLKDAPEEYVPPETYKASFGEVIAVGDLILCVMPRPLFQARKKYFRDMTRRQKEAVKSKVAEVQDPENPLYVQDKETFSRGNGTRRPGVQADDGG